MGVSGTRDHLQYLDFLTRSVGVGTTGGTGRGSLTGTDETGATSPRCGRGFPDAPYRVLWVCSSPSPYGGG